MTSFLTGFVDELQKMGSLSEEMSAYLNERSRSEDAAMATQINEQLKMEAKMQGSLMGQPGLPPGQDLPAMGEDLNTTSESYNPQSAGYGG